MWILTAWIMSLSQRFKPLAVALPAPQSFIRIVPKAVFFTVKQRAFRFAFIHAPPLRLTRQSLLSL
jgi:hypothetical protein